MLNESLLFEALVVSYASLMRDKERSAEANALALQAANISNKYEPLYDAISDDISDEEYQQEEEKLSAEMEAELREINHKLRILQIPVEDDYGYVSVSIRRRDVVWVMESNEAANHTFIKMYDGVVFHVKGDHEDVSELVFGIE